MAQNLINLALRQLGYSNYTHVCATAGQGTADWLGAQRGALEFMGGVPRVIVPDNPKALVSRALAKKLNLPFRVVALRRFAADCQGDALAFAGALGLLLVRFYYARVALPSGDASPLISCTTRSAAAIMPRC